MRMGGINTMCDKGVLVSILCVTYNHKDYIEDAIKGFDAKTNFAYEILIHDDASPDGTAEIVKKYEMLYPNIIKGIYQKDNQFSKGIRIMDTYMLPKANGKYIALCEGDDYWIDENKLQCQIDYMQAHPRCHYCFHNAIVKNMMIDGAKEEYPWDDYWRGTGSYNVSEMIMMKTPPTASVVFKKSSYPDRERIDSDKVSIGDKSIAIAITAKGYAYGIDKKMSVYRSNVLNSIVSSWKASIDARRKMYVGYREIMRNLDIYTEQKYTYYFNRFIEKLNEGEELLNSYSINDKKIKQLCKECENVYIYGAGMCAEICADYMLKNQLPFQGFIVSDEQRKLDDKCKHPIYYWKEIKDFQNIGIVVGLSPTYVRQILDNIITKRWCIGCFREKDREEYLKLDAMNTDI